MYVLIVNEDTTSSEESKKATRIKEAIAAIEPDIRIDIITGEDEGGADLKGAGQEKILRAQCFGEFEVFSKDGPLDFRRARSKELLAILICNRGSMLSMGRLMSILWEDGEDSDSDKSYLRSLISDLKKTLASIGAEDILIKKYNQIGIDTRRLECDYYDFLEGKLEAVEQYTGQFMIQYPWAEYEISRI